MDISKFSNEIKRLLEEEEFMDINILFGDLYDNGVLDYNIKDHTFSRFKKFIESKYEMKSKQSKVYLMNDLRLYSEDDTKHICVRELPSNYLNFKLPKNMNISSFRIVSRLERMVSNINFPSLINYDNIEENNVTYTSLKYKNSEIILEFIENKDILSINIKTKIDRYNIDSFINNFQFIISKIIMKRINLIERN